MKKIVVASATAAATLALTAGGLATSLQESARAIQVLTTADLDNAAVADIADVLRAVPATVQSFRYGSDPNSRATLPRDFLPAATPDLIGAATIDAGRDGWMELSDAYAADAWMHEFIGDGLVDGEDYVWLFSSRVASAQPAFGVEDYAAQVDFVIGFDGQDGWQELPQFPADTWQGGVLVASAYWSPSVNFDFSVIDARDTNLPRVDVDGAFFLGEDYAVAALSLKDLNAYGSGITWGFASHVHDGSYGECSSCESIVTAYPDLPRDAMNLYELDALIDFDNLSPTDPAGASDDGDEPRDSEGGGFPWWIIVVPVVAIGGFIWWGKKSSTPVPDACKDEKAALDAARSTRRGRQELVDNAKKFLADREAHVISLEDQRKEISTALRGPRGGVNGQDFARIDGRLIKFEDLSDLDKQVRGYLTEAKAEIKKAKADLTTRQKPLAEAKKAEDAAQKAFDACMKANVPGYKA